MARDESIYFRAWERYSKRKDIAITASLANESFIARQKLNNLLVTNALGLAMAMRVQGAP
jgi:hypothetical protein